MKIGSVSLSIAILNAAMIVNAAPFVESDPQIMGQPKATHCGILIDSEIKIESPVRLDTAGQPYCKYDLATVAVGSHTIRATFIVKDTVWGTLESVQSLPFSFTRPVVPATPTGLELMP